MVRSTTTWGVVKGGEELSSSSSADSERDSDALSRDATEGERCPGEDNALRLLFGAGEPSFLPGRAGAVDLKSVSGLGSSK
jgi:predicted RNA polymerase sigma factor